MVEMRRITITLALILVAGGLLAAPAGAHGATAAARSVQADFNHDGSDDLAVGVPSEDVGSTQDAGAVNVLYGTAGGLTGTGSLLVTQVGSAPESGDAFGAALATGDFNHDGFADLAVGAPSEDVFSTGNAGAVSVLYGSAAGLTRTGGQIFTQVANAPESDDNFGYALATGDFNHDGFADLAAGAFTEDAGSTSDVGAVSALYGSAAGLTRTGGQLFTQVGSAPEPFDQFGSALGTGDFDHDGFADLVVGAPFEDAFTTVDAGAVSVLYGSAAGLTRTGGQLFTQVGSAPEPVDLFGYALATGDFNQDGFADLAVGAPAEDVFSTHNGGAVSVLYGSAGKLTSTGGQLFTQVGSAPEPFDFFAGALGTGDFDQDGFADLAASAPYEGVFSIPNGGAVSVLYGSAGKLTSTGGQIFTQNSPGVPDAAEPDDLFGWALAAGDPEPSTASAAPSAPGSGTQRAPAFRN
jgi:hypothetical protein